MNPPLREAADRDAMHRGLARRHRSTSSRPTTRRITPTRRRSSSTARRSASSASRPRCRSCFDRLVHAGRDRAAAAGRAAVGRIRRGCSACRAARSPKAAPADITILAPDATRDRSRGGAAVEVEEHAVRRLDAARRASRRRSSAAASCIVNPDVCRRATASARGLTMTQSRRLAPSRRSTSCRSSKCSCSTGTSTTATAITAAST